MAVTRGNIITAIARQLHDPDMKDWELVELQNIANDAICQTVVAALTHNADVSTALVAAQKDYSGEPIFEPTMVSLGGEALNETLAGDPALATWSSLSPGIPEAWRHLSGPTIRLDRAPAAAALGLIGTVEVSAAAGGPGTGPGSDYEVGDVLELEQVGVLKGGKVTVTEVDEDGAVLAVELSGRDRSTRGSGYTGGTKTTQCAAKTARNPGLTMGCFITILALAKLEMTGYAGIAEPANDATAITALPEYLVKPAVVPLAIALALESRRTGTVNLQLADAKRKEWEWWTAKASAAARSKR